MKELVLLGAGASVEAGVPHAFDMTRMLLKVFEDNPNMRRHLSVLRFAIGGLIFQKGINGEDPFGGVNVEDLFNAVDLLSERHSLEAAPFIGSWHPIVDKLDHIPAPRVDIKQIFRSISQSVLRAVSEAGKRSANSTNERPIDDGINSLHSGKSSSKRLGAIIKDFLKASFDNLKNGSVPNGDFTYEREMENVLKQSGRPAMGAIFKKTNQLMVESLVKLTWIDDPNKVSYLTPLLWSERGSHRTIATLNYDNSIELAAELSSSVINSGLDEWSQRGEFPVGQGMTSFLKLHGSINWALDQAESSSTKPMPSSIITTVPPEKFKTSGFRPAILFGGKNKLTADGPFLDLYRAFRQSMARASLLTVIGYSFRDSHINQIITQWVNGDETRRVRIVNGINFENTEVQYARQLIGSLKSRIQILPCFAAEGIQKMYGLK